MKVVRLLAIAAITSLALVSCEKKDLTPQATRESNIEEFYESVSDGEGVSAVTIEITPCSLGLHVELEYTGDNLPQRIQYEIRSSETEKYGAGLRRHD